MQGLLFHWAFHFTGHLSFSPLNFVKTGLLLKDVRVSLRSISLTLNLQLVNLFFINSSMMEQARSKREKDGPKCTRVENSNFFTNSNPQGTFILSRLLL